jgi:hypothetical protein
LEFQGVGFSTNPAIRHVIKNDLDGIIRCAIVAKTAFFGDVIYCFASIVLCSSNARVERRSKTGDKQQYRKYEHHSGTYGKCAPSHSPTQVIGATGKCTLNIPSKYHQKNRRSAPFFQHMNGFLSGQQFHLQLFLNFSPKPTL